MVGCILEPMRVFLLAAGLGTRLRPLTNTRPKALIPVANRPAIVRLLELLQPYKFEETYINLHVMPEDVKDVTGGGSPWDMRIHYSYEPEILGTAGAIAKIGKFLAGDRFMMVNTDIITDYDLTGAIEFHEQTGAKATLIMATPSQVEDAEQEIQHITVSSDGRILMDRPSDDLHRVGIYSGIGIFEPSVIDMIPHGYSTLLHSVLIPLASEGSLYGYFPDGYWMDFGTIERYMQANKDLIDGKARLRIDGRPIGDNIWIDESAEIDLTVKIEEPVLIGKGASIERGCKIGPNVVIGKGCSVGPKVQISNTVIWDNCKIGGSVSIDSSIIADSHTISASQRLRRVILHGGVSEPMFNI